MYGQRMAEIKEISANADIIGLNRTGYFVIPDDISKYEMLCVSE